MFSWVILKKMKNEGEKSGEKIMFLIVWLRVEKGRDFGGSTSFLSPPLQTTISPLFISLVSLAFCFCFCFLFFLSLAFCFCFCFLFFLSLVLSGHVGFFFFSFFFFFFFFSFLFFFFLFFFKF